MAIPESLERLGTGGVGGSVVRGLHRVITSGKDAVCQLETHESGSLILLDRADGQAFILPEALEGGVYEFAITVAPTAGENKITTAEGDFILGAAADGTTIVSAVVTGAIGDRFQLTAINDGVWLVTGASAVATFATVVPPV